MRRKLITQTEIKISRHLEQESQTKETSKATILPGEQVQ